MLAVLGIGWMFFGPTALGGPANYVVTDGTSMLPHFRADGLVVTRAQEHYRVGEVVAYHNLRLHRVVMHRIVARDGDRYVFQGDNNDFRDVYHPTRSDLIGQEWLYWPGGGRFFDYLRTPVVFGILLGGIGLVVGAALIPAQQKRDDDEG